MVSYMDATAGSAYTDMNVVDIQVNLVVGCIEVVFVTKFLCSILVSIKLFFILHQLEIAVCQIWMKTNKNSLLEIFSDF